MPEMATEESNDGSDRNALRREVLGNPAWHSLVGAHAFLAVGNELAKRYPAECGPFAALRENTPEALAALREILDPNMTVSVTSEDPSIDDVGTLSVPGLTLTQLSSTLQMIDTQSADQLLSIPPSTRITQLGTADLPDILALIARTQPGPFGRRTLELGAYFGVRENGQLIAMAGERSRPGHFVEISAVCVDEQHRGKGLAHELMNHLRKHIVQHGGWPYLHVRAQASQTVALYERMQFSTIRHFKIYGVSRH